MTALSLAELDPDPLTTDADTLSRFREQPRPRRLGCSILPFLAGLAFWALLAAVVMWRVL